MPAPDNPNNLPPKLNDWLHRLPHPVHRTIIVFSGQGAREGYLAAIDQGLISLANFAATVILARNVSPTALGVYGVGFTVLRLVRAIQEGLTVQPMNTFGASMERETFRRYATATTIIQIFLAIISAASVALVGWAVTKTGNDTAGPALFSLWSAFLWWQLQEYIRRMMYTRGNVLGAVINTALANGVRLALMLWWARQGTLTGIGGLTAIGIGSLVALLPGIWQTRAFWSRRAANLVETWKRNWNFGRFILGASLSNWVSVEFYPVLTAGMISFAAAGAYRAIQNLVQPVQLLLRAMDTFMTPRAAKIYHRQGFKSLDSLLRKTYLIFAGPILGLLALAVIFRVPLLELLYGDTYLPYANGVILMALFYALWFAYWPLQTAMKAMHSSRPIFIANMAAIVAMFTVGIWFISQWGVYGTMAGQALNALIVAVIHFVAWRAMRQDALSRAPSPTSSPDN
jgi:O-antigen/teichoic acid export membrane protein